MIRKVRREKSWLNEVAPANRYHRRTREAASWIRLLGLAVFVLRFLVPLAAAPAMGCCKIIHFLSNLPFFSLRLDAGTCTSVTACVDPRPIQVTKPILSKLSTAVLESFASVASRTHPSGPRIAATLVRMTPATCEMEFLHFYGYHGGRMFVAVWLSPTSVIAQKGNPSTIA